MKWRLPLSVNDCRTLIVVVYLSTQGHRCESAGQVPCWGGGIANGRFEILAVGKRLLAIAYGRRNAEAILVALNARFGPGESLELFDVHDYDDAA
jgi:hypothetical protein